ncbi:MAG: NADH-quinone oxidoreductase subunit J [Acidimicrobiales bacterium]
MLGSLVFAQNASCDLDANANCWDLPANIAFYVIAIIAVGAALRMVTTSNVVHSALYLLVVLAAVAAVYILLGAEFVAVTQVLVYIGAILVLLLFGVMLTRAKLGGDEDLNYEQRWIGLGISTLLFVVMAYSVWEEYGTDRSSKLVGYEPQRTAVVADSIFSTYIVPFEAVSVLLLAALIGAVVVARRD